MAGIGIRTRRQSVEDDDDDGGTTRIMARVGYCKGIITRVICRITAIHLALVQQYGWSADDLVDNEVLERGWSKFAYRRVGERLVGGI